MMLNIHYNNQDLTPGLTDNTGFRIYYTPNMATYNMGFVQVCRSFLNLQIQAPTLAGLVLPGRVTTSARACFQRYASSP